MSKFMTFKNGIMRLQCSHACLKCTNSTLKPMLESRSYRVITTAIELYFSLERLPAETKRYIIEPIHFQIDANIGDLSSAQLDIGQEPVLATEQHRGSQGRKRNIHDGAGCA